MKWTGKNISSLKLLKKRALLPRFINIPFVIFYAYAFYHCALTFGDPYVDRIQDLRAEGKLNDSTITPEEIEAALADTNIALPNPYLPGLIPLLMMTSSLCIHALIWLVQVWYIDFKTILQFSPASSLAATHAKATPKPHCGKTEIVPILQGTDPDHGSYRYFIFQRKKYIQKNSEDGQIIFEKQKPTLNHPLSHYLSSSGISTKELALLKEKYGKNEFSIPQPTFKELYLQQLLQPIIVFEMFSTLLWLLDEYWQYSLFSALMILVCEATTVFSRLKSLQMLKGMGNSGKEIFVFRNGSWSNVSTLDLVPGDIISVRFGTSDNILPCDCLLLKGTCVVNEASLTGESHPQMKEELAVDSKNEPLDMKGLHRVHVLFGGTTLMQHAPSKIPDGLQAHDDGCVALVLRIGFDSSQGKLVSMIEHSVGNEQVRDDSWDALFLVLFLMVFAVTASGYVLVEGLRTKDRNRFDLLLHCVMIITSVIPPSLPMQTAMGVQYAFLTLMKLNIFCTEQFRIPTAGKVDTCFFDKTGTITADQLTAVGIIGNHAPRESAIQSISPMIEAPYHVALVLGGCHSLVSIGGKISGDPVEEAALHAIQFTFDPVRNASFPKPLAQPASILQGPNVSTTSRGWSQPARELGVSIEALHRHHFASKLQRMSVIARVNDGQGSVKTMALVKGSPEVIATLLRKDPNNMPTWYWNTYSSLTRAGMRVLALGYKDLEDKGKATLKLSREEVESELEFAGFVAFRCLVRKDSKEVLRQLTQGSHNVIMITGDATLTAAHVANEVGIVKSSEVLILQTAEERTKSAADAEKLEWVKVDGSVHCEFKDDSQFPQLAKACQLCVSGKSFSLAVRQCPAVWRHVTDISIYARMTPEFKERVISSAKERGHFCLMCGDGANDVGALKQAHVGVALLSGFGSLNVDKAATTAPNSTLATPAPVDKAKEAQLLKERQEKQKEELQKKKADLQRRIEEETAKRAAAGDSCPAIRGFCTVISDERQKAKAEAAKGLGGFAMKGLEQYLDGAEGMETPMIKPGDASVAAPFTSKIPSIQATVDIIRQGRCTLVTTLQSYQILALNCIISAYSLSVLHLDGIKYGEQQMIASGLLLTISFLTLSYASPLKELSPVRPLTTIFHPSLFISLLGQIILHVGCMYTATSLAKGHMPGWTPKLGLKFEPNLLNTVVFLVSTVQSVSVFSVNYKGRPFMESMTDKPGLLYSLGACGLGVIIAASESVPVLNKYLQLVPFPSADFANTILQLLIINVAGAFLWDFFCVTVFTPKIMKASLSSTTREDIKKLAKMGLVMYVLFNWFMPSEETYQLIQDELAKQAAASAQ